MHSCRLVTVEILEVAGTVGFRVNRKGERAKSLELRNRNSEA